jgi:protein phosphatase
MIPPWLSFTAHLEAEGRGEQGPAAHPTGLFAIPFHFEGYSLKGRSRAINEDQFRSVRLALPSGPRDEEALLLVVADGLGGEAAGEHASRIAADSMAHYVRLSSNWESEKDPEGLMKSAAIQAHLDILADCSSHPGQAGMGTTLTAALVVWPFAYLIHAGDSRAYLVRNGRLIRLTVDHTVEQQLREQGLLGSFQTSRFRNVLWNHLGGSDHFPVVESSRIHLVLGDALFLASDGVTDSMPEEDLAELASSSGSPEGISRKLVLAAQGRGGRDDATALYAQFGAPSVPGGSLRRWNPGD